jgi:hypothetical protein
MEYTSNTQNPPTHNELKELINRFLESRSIGLDRATPIKGNGVLQNDIAKLRAFGLLQPQGSYRLTEAGTFLLQQYSAPNFPVALKWENK